MKPTLLWLLVYECDDSLQFTYVLSLEHSNNYCIFAVITMQHNIVLTYLQYDLVLTLILTFIIVSLIEYNMTSDFRTTVKSADVSNLMHF